MSKVAIYFSFILAILYISCEPSLRNKVIKPEYIEANSISFNKNNELIVSGTTNSYANRIGYKTIFHYNTDTKRTDFKQAPASAYNPELELLDNGDIVEIFYGPKSEIDETEFIRYNKRYNWFGVKNEISLGPRARNISSSSRGNNVFSIVYMRAPRYGELVCFGLDAISWRKKISFGKETTLPTQLKLIDKGILVSSKLDLPHKNDGHDYIVDTIRSSLTMFDENGNEKWTTILAKEGSLLMEGITVNENEVVSLSTFISSESLSSDILITTFDLANGKVKSEQTIELPNSQQARLIEYHNGRYYVLTLEEDDISSNHQGYLTVINKDLVVESKNKLTADTDSERILDCQINGDKIHVLLQSQKCRNCDITSSLVSYDLKTNKMNTSVIEITYATLMNRA